jgi:hypothetical protein
MTLDGVALEQPVLQLTDDQQAHHVAVTIYVMAEDAITPY